MSYYQVIYNRKVIDVLDRLVYCKLQLKHKVLLLCQEKEAQGILSSDCSSAYHTSELLPFPVSDYPTVTIEEITKTEYDRLKDLNFKTADEIREDLITELIERGIL